MSSIELTKLTGQSEKHFTELALIDNINQSGIFPQFPNTQTECHESSVPEYLLNCHGLDGEKHFKIV